MLLEETPNNPQAGLFNSKQAKKSVPGKSFSSYACGDFCLHSFKSRPSFHPYELKLLGKKKIMSFSSGINFMSIDKSF